MTEMLIILTLFVLIYSYMILASVDFGAGFYAFYTRIIKRNDSLFAPLHDYLSPVSEITNICFVLLFAAISGLSPDLSFRYQTPLGFVGILAVILILVKGTFFTLAELLQKNTTPAKICVAGNGIAGILVPAALSITMVVSEGGFADQGQHGPGMFIYGLLTNVYFWTVMLIAMTSVLYISAMYFVFFARACRNEELSEAMRYQALFLSMPVVLASGLVFLGLEIQNPDHFIRSLDFSWLFLLSLVCLLLAVTLVFRKRFYGLAFFLVMLQYFFALAGYGLSHLPYVIYPDIRIDETASALAEKSWVILAVLILSLGAVSAVLRIKSSMMRRNMAYKKQNR